MNEYDVPIDGFSNFQEFFLRDFKQGIRKFNSKICAFCEGTIKDNGPCHNMIQAKKHKYELKKLIDMDGFENYNYFTIYLNPGNYHGIHFPVDSTLVKYKHISGKLFCVNEKSTKKRLVYPENTRLIVECDSKEIGKYLLVLIAAYNVSDFDMLFNIEKGRTENLSGHYKKDNLLGKFRLGSTVIMIADANFVEKYDEKILLGENIKKFRTY